MPDVTPLRTCCAIAALLTWWSRARTCGRCKPSWDMLTFPRPRFTPTWPSIISRESIVNTIRGRRAKHVQHNPAALVATPRLPKKLPRVPTIEEMNAIFQPNEQVEQRAAFPARDRLIFELLYGCGVRNSELVGINLSDVHFSNEVILVRGKGRKERLTPFGPAARDALTGYLKERQKLLSEKKKSTSALLINLRGR